MDITRTTVGGAGTLHDVRTRGGQHFRIFVRDAGGAETYIYPETDPDEVITVELESDEADAVANILHSRPILDQLAELHRRVTALEGDAQR